MLLRVLNQRLFFTTCSDQQSAFEWCHDLTDQCQTEHLKIGYKFIKSVEKFYTYLTFYCFVTALFGLVAIGIIFKSFSVHKHYESMAQMLILSLRHYKDQLNY